MEPEDRKVKWLQERCLSALLQTVRWETMLDITEAGYKKSWFSKYCVWVCVRI